MEAEIYRPAISVPKSGGLPGAWTQCQVCHATRLPSNLATLSYRIIRIAGAFNNLLYCRDNDVCRTRALERKHSAETL